MERDQFSKFADKILRFGAAGVDSAEFDLALDGQYRLQYIPFEHVNREARLVIVGITPGPTQLQLAYEAVQQMLINGRPEAEISVEVKKIGAFGGRINASELSENAPPFQF